MYYMCYKHAHICFRSLYNCRVTIIAAEDKLDLQSDICCQLHEGEICAKSLLPVILPLISRKQKPRVKLIIITVCK